MENETDKMKTVEECWAETVAQCPQVKPEILDAWRELYFRAFGACLVSIEQVARTDEVKAGIMIRAWGVEIDEFLNEVAHGNQA